MPQNFFEPRNPVTRVPSPGIAPGLEPPRRAADVPEADVPEPEVPEPEVPESAAVPPGRGEPSWIRVYWNTLRSFARRRFGLGPPPRRIPGAQAPQPRRRSVPLLLVLAAAVVVAALAVAAVLADTRASRPEAAARSTGPRSAAPAAGPASPVRAAAAQWIVDNVGAGHVVACDAAVCGALTSLGFPASSLTWVQNSIQDLQSADVAVLTPTLNARFGATLAPLTAPEPLAVFGSGTQTVTVTAVAHAGRPGYAQQTAADLNARRLAGRALLANHRISFAPQARTLLGQGLVDLRICALLAFASSGHTLTVSGFGPAAPGAGPDIPHSWVEITTVDHTPATGGSAAATALRALVAAQRAPYQPLATTSQPGSAGAPAALLLRYAQPEPAGLLENPAA
jgi:hypothetical protein